MNTKAPHNRFGFLERIWAIFMKEVTQMRRDRLTFAMMFGIPIMQLTLFGYAINNDPKHLPTAVVVEQSSPIIRSMLKAMENSDYFDFVVQLDDPRETEHILARGDVAFVVEFPAGFTEKLIRGERPQVLIEADATDPTATANAIGKADAIFTNALRHELTGALRPLERAPPPYELVVHPKYNPEGFTQYNIIPGLLGMILTMTMVMITSMAMTRETELGTMENLLALPAKPVEVMIGKITPYIAVGIVQTTLILVLAVFLFGVPFIGEIWLLLLGVAIFIIANLSIGFTFSTFAKNQMQAMQLTFFFFLPSILLSGFMFPFRGMPKWAQYIGEALPMTQFLRIVRGVMLKGVSIADIHKPLIIMAVFTVVVMVIAMLRYDRTLD